jgi:hypothetical protein
MRPDRHLARDRLVAESAHGRVVTGMEPAGDARARDDCEQLDIAGHAFADVRVQVNGALEQLGHG